MHPMMKFDQKTRILIDAISITAKRFAAAKSYESGIAEVKEMAGGNREYLNYACAELIASAYNTFSGSWNNPHAAGILVDAGADIFAVDRLLLDWPKPTPSHSAPFTRGG